MVDFIKPNWDIEEFKTLNYILSTHKDGKLVDQYLTSGHSKEKLSIYKYQLPNKMPKCVDEYIIPHFTFLDKVTPAVNYFKPGQYLPLHIDLYGKYIKINDYISQIICLIIYILIIMF